MSTFFTRSERLCSVCKSWDPSSPPIVKDQVLYAICAEDKYKTKTTRGSDSCSKWEKRNVDKKAG